VNVAVITLKPLSRRESGGVEIKLRKQFGLRIIFAIVAVCAIAFAVWKSIPRQGWPILHGVVLDTNGAPVPNVKISLYSGIATRWLTQSTRTDANGLYSFVPLKSGGLTYSEPGGFDNLYVGIRAELKGYSATDGAEWWDISVPMIYNRRHRWDLEMKPVSKN